MKNKYFLMRHGESESNIKDQISCDPNEALEGNGLTKNGRKQVLVSTESFASRHDIKPVVISSDFLRAKQTAQILAEACGVETIFDPRLRERDFGEFSGKSTKNYEKVWQLSDKNPKATPFGAESSRAVLERFKSVIDECETRYRGKDIFLVSHGDPVVIARSYFERGNLTSIVRHFANAEIYELKQITPQN